MYTIHPAGRAHQSPFTTLTERNKSAFTSPPLLVPSSPILLPLPATAIMSSSASSAAPQQLSPQPPPQTPNIAESPQPAAHPTPAAPTVSQRTQHASAPSSHPHRAQHKRPGHWLPHQDGLERWLDKFHAEAATHAPQKAPHPRHPVIKEVEAMIERDPLVRMYLTNMIEQQPKHKAYTKRHINSIEQLLTAINHILHTAPRFDTTELVGAPLNAVLDFMMDTPAGYEAFRSKPVNDIIRKLLHAWADFLGSPASASVLHAKKGGWLCEEAAQQINLDEFILRPAAEAAHPSGFNSWNDFFTRRFKLNMRPVASPDNDKVIVAACESTPYAISLHVQRSASFWIKSQPYSLHDMLDNDERADQFVGGTIYQAFLSALFYHRWHSPINGTVVATRLVPGTYFSELEAEGFDPAGPNNSQGYITHTAARALLFLKADDPVIGLMAMVFVGMAEVSSCVFDAQLQPGSKVKKGQEIGTFQYGGSTHCLIFRPGVVQSFMAAAIPQGAFGEGPPAVRLSTPIAIAN